MSLEDSLIFFFFFFFFQAEDGIRDLIVTGVQTCALPICDRDRRRAAQSRRRSASASSAARGKARSEEHTSELQPRSDLVCRLLLEKKTDVAGPGGPGAPAPGPSPAGGGGGRAEPRSDGGAPRRGKGENLANGPRRRLFFLMKGRPPRSQLFPSPAFFR